MLGQFGHFWRAADTKIFGIFFVVLAPTFICARDFETLNHLKTKVAPSVQAKSVQDLIARVVPSRAGEFKVVIDPSIGPPNRDTYNIFTNGGVVNIKGTTGVGAAMGFYYYVKYYCGGQFTWAGQQTDLPAKLPEIPSPGVTKTTNDQFRYYQNVCTVSYSFAWHDWPRWVREIDWMAMQGINLPLAFTGQEAIFQRVYSALGFTQQDLDEHFGGPAFLAWARMGNIRGWGGPLPQAWIDNRLILQHKILDRMRSLGMIPVLPGFAGHVPAAITRLFPKANATRLGPWGHFSPRYTETYLLDFTDPLFTKIGSSFIKQMEYEFGVDHIYNADSFNEMTPKSSEPAYLASASKGVFQAMTAGDPKAIWLMQGWLFHGTSFWKPPQVKALLTAVPLGRMIILDLNAELSPVYKNTDSFFGQPFIWCMLHDFGGTMELYGDLGSVNVGPFAGRKFPNSTMVGTGITPEGINQNEVMYEFMNENAWRTAPRNISEWITDFQSQRYGGSSNNTVQAWNLLKGSVYSCTDGHGDFNDVYLTRRPNLVSHRKLWYNPEDLFKAWDFLFSASKTFAANKLYRYDLVDVTRNSLQILSVKYYTDILAAFTNSDSVKLESAGTKMIDLLSDLDTVLASDEHFLVGKWIAAAKAIATDVNETMLYEYNARNQITMWGPDAEILDYAAKQWSGLINDYFKNRWQIFIKTLDNCIKTKTKFDQNKFNNACFELVEKPFTLHNNVYPVTTKGDSIEIVAKLHQKYRPDMQSKFFEDLAHFSEKEQKLTIKNTADWDAKQWGKQSLGYPSFIYTSKIEW